jgi:hypothetical protein
MRFHTEAGRYAFQQVEQWSRSLGLRSELGRSDHGAEHARSTTEEMETGWLGRLARADRLH